MSAAPATDDAAAAPAGGGKKKLIIIIVAAVVVVLLLGGGAAFYFMQQKAAAQAAALADEEGGGEDEHASSSHGKAEKPERPEHAPTFVPLDPFVVNLADKETDRFAQVGLSLQVEEAKVADEIKSYMPAIRNSILLILAHKTSSDLLSPEGKELLAKEIKWGATRAMGYEVPDPEDEADAASEDEEEVKPKKKRKKKKKVEPYSPIVQVHYATLVVQ